MNRLRGEQPAGLGGADLPRLELLAELRAALASRPELDQEADFEPEALEEQTEPPGAAPALLESGGVEQTRRNQKQRKRAAKIDRTRKGFSRKYWQDQISRPSLLGLFSAVTAGLGGLASCLLLLWQLEASLSGLADGRENLAGLRGEENRLTGQLDRQLQDNLAARTALAGRIRALPNQTAITARMTSLIEEARQAGFPVLGWQSDKLARASQMLDARRVMLKFQASFTDWLALRADWLDRFSYLEIRAEKLTASGHTDGLLDIEAEIILHARSPG